MAWAVVVVNAQQVWVFIYLTNIYWAIELGQALLLEHCPCRLHNRPILHNRPVTLVGERKSVLLPELAGFTNLCLPATKFGQSEYYLFRLQVLKPLVVDVAYPLVPQVDIRLGFLSLCEHCGATVSGVEDEHPPISAPLRNHTAFFLNEAPEVCELNLHPLVDDLPYRDQVLRDCQNV